MPTPKHLSAHHAVLLAIFAGLLFASPSVADEPKLPNFAKEVLPILRNRCVRCHGPKKQESRVRLDNLSTNLVKDRAAAEYWHEVLNVVNGGEMPPEDQPQLTDSEQETLTRWVRGSLDAAIEARRRTDGRVVLRRLNRVEYANTMFDLLGLEMDHARDLPPDPESPDGFRNNGAALQISSLQLGYYLQTARRALARVIVSGPEPQVFEHSFTESNVKNWLGGVERSNRLGRRQSFLGVMPKDYPETGEFRIRATVSTELREQAGFPLLEVAVGYRPDTKILFREVEVVELTNEDEQVLEFRGRLENHPLPVRGQGKFPGLVVRLRNVYDDGSPLPGKSGKKDKKKGTTYPDEPNLPVIHVKSVEFRAPYFEQWPPASHRRILFESELKETDEPAYAAEVLARFMRRAYRRPVAKPEVAAMVEFFKQIRPEFPNFEEAIQETLAMVLIRPDFLYLLEPAGSDKRPVTAWELASRLSYFLWSTMPDDELFQLAAAGELGKPDVLNNQVERMLDDARSDRFVEQFTTQWLKLNVIDSVAVDSDYYPKFNEALKNDMRREPQQLVRHLLHEDLSALNLLKSDFVMVNETLAKHYDLGEGAARGREFRPVAVEPDSHRGGLLGQAGILLANSTGADSHPVRRAVWIRDRLLDDPPAPPPPNVPALDEADPKFQKMSVREQLVLHRGDKSCANCHLGIDAWGVALENFDAVGLWRNEIRRKAGKKFTKLPVTANDTLPNGVKLDGFQGLRDYLFEERKDDFAKSLARRLLTYALGRRLEITDQDELNRLVSKFSENDYRLRDLVRQVVASKPFQTK